MNKITIIDGNNLFYKFWMVQTYKKRNNMNSGFAFFKFLDLIEEHDKFSKKIYVVWDKGHSKRRKKLYPEYKENRKDRKEKEEDVMIEMREFFIDKIQKFCYFAKIYSIEIKGTEGDDIIAVITKENYKNYRIEIISYDSDFYQLLKYPNVFTPYIKKIPPVKPNKYTLWKSIVGDTSDGIQGVSGIGEVKAKIFLTDPKHKDFEIIKNIVLKNKDIVQRNMKLIDFDYITKETYEEIKEQIKNQTNYIVIQEDFLKFLRREKLENYINMAYNKNFHER